MPSPDDVLNIERRMLDQGVKEIPNGSNHVVGITDQPGRWPDSWCDMFQMECLMHAGVPVGPGSRGSASVITTFNWYRSRGRTFTDHNKVRKGDLVGFHFSSGHSGLNHIGMVEGVRPDGVITIEGNVGNAVRRQFRSFNGSGIVEFARPDYDESVVVSPPSSQNPNISYAIGSSGEFVKNIQTVVGAKPDGQYGPRTADAVKAWQRKLHITDDGVWGPQTQDATNKLFEYLGKLQANQGNILLALKNASESVLKQGSTGDNVKILQTLINNHMGFVAVDGNFGPQTTKAVKDYQKGFGLPIDGIVGPNTWKSLLRPT